MSNLAHLDTPHNDIEQTVTKDNIERVRGWLVDLHVVNT
jgi:hypothetical protein